MTPISAGNELLLTKNSFPGIFHGRKTRAWFCLARFHRADQDGFTLLEFLLVLTIIGLAGAFIVPRLGDLDTRGFNVEVREATNLLNQARRNAIVSGNPATVSFLPESEDEPLDYRVPVFSAGVFEARDIELHFLDSAGQRETVEEPLEVTFFPEGGSTGGALLLLRGDRSASIEINPVTGRMETAYDEEPTR